MRRNVGIKLFALAAVAALVVAAALAVKSGAAKRQAAVLSARSGAGAAAAPAAPAAGNDDRLLKEKAKGSGRYVGHEDNKAPAYPGLSELAGHSAAVIIGTPEENLCRLTPDGKSITIDYKVSVRHAYKGDLREGETVTVSLPGGVAVLDDGTSVEVRTPWFKKMQDGKTYALFLSEDAVRGTFVPTGGPQGVFEIPVTKESRVVKSHSGLRGDPIWAYHDMEVTAFLKEVRKAAKR